MESTPRSGAGAPYGNAEDTEGSIRLSPLHDLSHEWPHSLVLIPSSPSNLLMTIIFQNKLSCKGRSVLAAGRNIFIRTVILLFILNVPVNVLVYSLVFDGRGWDQFPRALAASTPYFRNFNNEANSWGVL